MEFGIAAARVCYQLMRWAANGGGRVALRPGVTVGDLTPDLTWLSESTLARIDDLEPVYRKPPDLAVEIIRPAAAWTEMEERAHRYVALQTPLVWLVDPYAQCVHVYGHGRDNEIFSGPERLQDAALLPGFSLSVSELFD
ncbi:MAG: Uma2 family endonuclease [Candidatus Xenobia bacterium]